MIISEKCNCCVHEHVCSFKSEYLAACEAIKNARYTTENGGHMIVKNSTVDVHIRCPHMMTRIGKRGTEA